MLRVHLVAETPPDGPVWACAEIRLLRPYGHASLQKRLSVSSGPSLPFERVDVVVTQRSGPWATPLGELAEFVREVRRSGAALVYDLDDDLLSEHPSAVTESRLDPIRPHIRFLLREADAVVVSTPVLAERVAVFNPVVHVWANAVDEALIRPLDPERSEAADLGYFGTASHLEDLLSVLEDLRTGLTKGSTVELCGVSEDPRVSGLFGQDVAISNRPTGGYAEVLEAFQRAPAWKAGMSPLAVNRFNAAKSDIKFLDYAVFGAPAIVSANSVYGAVRDGETGLVAGPGEWGAALRRLLEDGDLRRRIRLNAREYLMQERTLARRAGDLWPILQSVV